MKTRILAAVLLLTASTACSSPTKSADSTLSATDQAAIHALETGLTNGAGTFDVDQDQADCVAEGLVTRLGIDALQRYGLLDANLKTSGSLGDRALSEGDAEIVADVVVGCVDTEALFQAIQQGESTIPARTVRCLQQKLDDAALKRLFVIVLAQDQNVNGWGDDIIDPLTECLGG